MKVKIWLITPSSLASDGRPAAAPHPEAHRSTSLS